MKKKILWIVLGVIFFLAFDQLSKWAIRSFLTLGESHVIIPHFFSLTYVQNTGAAFSMLEGKVDILVLLSIAALFFLSYTIVQKKTWTKLELFFYVLWISGILGNLIDRLFCGYVIDFFDFRFGSYQFAIFNFADVWIVSGSLLLLFLLWKENDHERTHCQEQKQG